MIDIYQYEITVGKESIDILGHVNNREYLRWMEKAAIEHAASLGWDAKRYLQRGETWVAREHWIEYLRQTYEGERLTVYSWLFEALCHQKRQSGGLCWCHGVGLY